MSIFWFTYYLINTPYSYLANCVRLKKPNFKQENFKQEKIDYNQCNDTQIYKLHLQSQNWKNIQWKHNFQVFVPRTVLYPDTILLLISGGQPSENGNKIGIKLVQIGSSPFAILHQVPNQLLYDGQKEDDLIAHTLERYLETKDSCLLLLFPMVKSVIQAITALTEFTEKEWSRPIEKFVITRASKRG